MTEVPEYTVADTAPLLTGTVGASLVGATARVHIRRSDGTVINQPVTIIDPAAGTWSYAWAVDDLNGRGAWPVEVEVTFSNGKVQTFYQADGDTAAYIKVRDQIA